MIRHFVNCKLCIYGPKVYICPVEDCKKVLQSMKLLEDHANMHAGLKPYKCDECDFATHSRPILSSHQVTHLRKKGAKMMKKRKIDFQCPHCDYTAANRSELAGHVRRIHLSEDKLPCVKCGKLISSDHMTRHLISVHGEKTLACPECDEKYASSAQLNRHRKVVHEAPKHVCDFCGDAFKFSGSLKNHIRRHTGELPYACQFCDYKAKSSSVLRRHNIAKHKDKVPAVVYKK